MAGVLGPVKDGGERDTSSGLGLRMRGRTVADVGRRGRGTQYMLVVEVCVMVRDWMVRPESTATRSKAVRRGRSCMLGGSEGWLGQGMRT